MNIEFEAVKIKVMVSLGQYKLIARFSSSPTPTFYPPPTNFLLPIIFVSYKLWK